MTLDSPPWKRYRSPKGRAGKEPPERRSNTANILQLPNNALNPTAINVPKSAAPRTAREPRNTALRLRGALLAAWRRVNAKPLGGHNQTR